MKGEIRHLFLGFLKVPILEAIWEVLQLGDGPKSCNWNLRLLVEGKSDVHD